MQNEFGYLDQFSGEGVEGVSAGPAPRQSGSGAHGEHTQIGTDQLGDASFRLGNIIN